MKPKTQNIASIVLLIFSLICLLIIAGLVIDCIILRAMAETEDDFKEAGIGVALTLAISPIFAVPSLVCSIVSISIAESKKIKIASIPFIAISGIILGYYAMMFMFI